MITEKQIIMSWFVLIALTLISVFVSGLVDSKALFLFIVLLIVFIKGYQITDIFMELRNAPRMWRITLLSYVFIIPAVICAIYIL